MIPFSAEWNARRALLAFSERCTAHLRDVKERDTLRSRIRSIATAMIEKGKALRLDPRFQLRVEMQDLEENRLEYILERFDGLRYAEDLQFRERLERLLVASHQHAGLRFQMRRLPGRAPVFIRLIDTTIGFGLFAARELEEGELVGEYAGYVSYSDAVTDRTYCYEYPALHYGGEDTVLVLDAGELGNETRFINHDTREVVNHGMEFFNGHWRVVFAVKTRIEKGEQLFINYGPGYWEGSARTPVPLSSRVDLEPEPQPGQCTPGKDQGADESEQSMVAEMQE